MKTFKTLEEAYKYCDDNASYEECGCGCCQSTTIVHEIIGYSVWEKVTDISIDGELEESEEVIGIIEEKYDDRTTKGSA